MNIGFFLENYRQGGLDRILVEKIINWPNKKDKIIIFCNDDHQGLNYLKQELSKVATFYEYKSPYYNSNKINLKFFNIIYKYFYLIIYSYLRMFIEINFFKKVFNDFDLNGIFIHTGGWPGASRLRWLLLDPRSAVEISCPQRFDAVKVAGPPGGVAEWSKAAVLKTAVPRGTVGSNPTASVPFLKSSVEC